MLLALKIKMAVAAAAFVASPVAVSVLAPAPHGGVEAPVVVELKPGTAPYWPPGEFIRDGKPGDPPPATIHIRRAFKLMKYQVTVADYQRCVADKACAALPPDAAANLDRPAVMVSFRDAQAYARWLSGKTGARYRLPTDEEWTFAAGSRAPDEAPLSSVADDPVARWLYHYDREARSQPADPATQPIGSFGVNENGVADIGGNVWEWTSTCFTRSLVEDGKTHVVTENCGVRVVEGRHRTYITDFIRDARAGGCAVGTPPSNLGFRLIREEASGWFMSWLERLTPRS